MGEQGNAMSHERETSNRHDSTERPPPTQGFMVAEEIDADFFDVNAPSNPRPSGLGQQGPQAAPRSVPAKHFVKLTANLGIDVYNALKGLASKRGTTVTECLRHAISTEQWLQERQEHGDKILVRDRRGRLFEVVFR